MKRKYVNLIATALIFLAVLSAVFGISRYIIKLKTPGQNLLLNEKDYAAEMLPEEAESIQWSNLSSAHPFYDVVTTIDSQCTQYIKELSIYDKEIDDYFVVHLSLPPGYDDTKKYPMVVMTDGVWRLSDHPELRKLMVSEFIEPLILVSIGYPDDYDYEQIRERDLVKDPESFLHFIVDNLVPYLTSVYSVDTTNMTLTGHSYGGYWGLFALFNSDLIGKNTFKNYFIGSPSLQASTNRIYIPKYEEAYLSRTHTLHCNVYMTVGEKEPLSFTAPIERLLETIEKHHYRGLNLEYEVIYNYDHNTVFKPSISNALYRFYGKK